MKLYFVSYDAGYAGTDGYSLVVAESSDKAVEDTIEEAIDWVYGYERFFEDDYEDEDERSDAITQAAWDNIYAEEFNPDKHAGYFSNDEINRALKLVKRSKEIKKVKGLVV